MILDTYSTSLSSEQNSQDSLNSKHLKECVGDRGLDRDWVESNCFSVTDTIASQKLGYTALSDGIWLKGYNRQSQFKPDKPWKKKGDKKAAKYRSPKGDEYDAMLPAHPTDASYWSDLEALKARAYKKNGYPCLVITEGFFKAIAGCSNGIPTIALLGVEMGLTSSSADIQGKRYLVPILEHYAKKGFGFIFGNDADCAENKNVLMAQHKLAHQLKLFKVPLYNATGLWTVEEGKGMDDYIQNNGDDHFKREILEKAVDIETWEKQFSPTEDLLKKSIKPPTSRQLGLEIAEKYQPIWAYHDEQQTWRIYNGKTWEAVNENGFGQQVFNEIESRNIQYSTDNFVDITIKTIKRKLLILKWTTFDSKNYIAFENGVLNLQTGLVEPHNPGYRFLSFLPYTYNPIVQTNHDLVKALEKYCPNTHKYMIGAMEDDKAKIIKLLAIINGIIKYRFHDLQQFVYLVGKSGTGKGIFSRICQKVVGKLNYHGSSLQNLHEPIELAAIIDKQLVVCPDERKQVGVEAILKLTGGDDVRYRYLYKNPNSSPFYGLLMVISNSPVFAGDTQGLDRRLCLLTFNKQIPTNQRDSQIEKLMEDELPKLISVALSLSDDAVTKAIKGVGDSEIPELKLQEWQMKVRTNSVAAFVNNYLITNPDASVQMGNGKNPDTLYGAYLERMQSEGYKNLYNLVNFSEQLNQIWDYLGWSVQKEKTNRGITYQGVKLRDFFIDCPTMEQILEGEVTNKSIHSVNTCEHLVNTSVNTSNPDPEAIVNTSDENNEKKVEDFDEQLSFELFTCSQPSHNEHLRCSPEYSPGVHKCSPPEQLSLPNSTDKPLALSNNQSSISAIASAQPVAATETATKFNMGDPVAHADPFVNSESVEVFYFDKWLPATILQYPNNHPDPKQRVTSWKVRSSTGQEIHIWDERHLRPV